MAEIPGESRDYRPIKSVISRTNRRHIATHIILSVEVERWEKWIKQKVWSLTQRDSTCSILAPQKRFIQVTLGWLWAKNIRFFFAESNPSCCVITIYYVAPLYCRVYVVVRWHIDDRFGDQLGRPYWGPSKWLGRFINRRGANVRHCHHCLVNDHFLYLLFRCP